MTDIAKQDEGHLSKKDEMHLDRWQRNSGADQIRNSTFIANCFNLVLD